MSHVHLHVHTEHSKLDGMARVKELLKRAQELGQTSLAITDHGTCGGLYELFKYAPEYGIKPIYGCEFYLDIGEKKRNHIVLLAKNNNGLSNIFKLHEWSYVHGFKTKPTINMDILSTYSSDIVCMSACLANIIPRAISEGNIPIAREWALEFKNMFGEDFYLEVQSNTIPEQYIANKGIVALAKELNIQYVATNDVHYELKSDAWIHDVMLCMQINKKVDDEKRWKFPTQDFWFKDEREMADDLHGLSQGECNIAIENTNVIANKCNATLTPGRYIPKYHEIEDGKSEEQMLRELVTKRYKEEIIDKGLHTSDYAKDVKEELRVIEATGYSGYHLIVQDFVNYARESKILVGDGRGSGAGCKVAYITKITRVEPTKYNLLFERFLAEGREPDYDIDFADNNLIFKYLQEKHGVANVAKIVANGTLAPKAVTRKVFSAYGHHESVISQVAGAILNTPKTTLKASLEASPKLREFKKRFSKEFAVMERLEGRISHTSTHAGGVIIYPNLSSMVPVHTDSDDRTKRVVSFDKYMIEAMGFCKIDCLGLVALETINTCLNTMEEEFEERVDIYDIDYEDPKIYDDLCRGDVSGVFQLEAQSGMLMNQKPRTFADLIAINALIRPGVGDFNEYVARRNGKEYTINPLRKSYMDETEGLITYQEQFELDCQTFAGWSIAFADKYVRKNKNIREDEDLKRKFLVDTLMHGHDPEEMEELWEEIVLAVEKGYSFNKSHACSYAVISYRTAWLKHYYPEHWYASLMNKYYDDSATLLSLIAECRQKDVKLLPPSLNLSMSSFIPTRDGILYALNSVKGLGESAYEHLIGLRPIVDLNDLLVRSTRKLMRENVIANLIRAGCFDYCLPNRITGLQELKTFFKSKKEYEILSDMENEYIALGVYLRKHPLDSRSFQPLSMFKDNEACLIGGIIVDVATIFDKKGGNMAFVTINSQYGNTKCLIFSYLWTNKKLIKQEDFVKEQVIMIRGKRSGNDVLLNSYEVLT